MPKLALTIANGVITHVYISPEMLGEIEIHQLDYDKLLMPSDENIEQEIDENKLIKIA